MTLNDLYEYLQQQMEYEMYINTTSANDQQYCYVQKIFTLMLLT